MDLLDTTGAEKSQSSSSQTQRSERPWTIRKNPFSDRGSWNRSWLQSRAGPQLYLTNTQLQRYFTHIKGNNYKIDINEIKWNQRDRTGVIVTDFHSSKFYLSGRKKLINIKDDSWILTELNKKTWKLFHIKYFGTAWLLFTPSVPAGIHLCHDLTPAAEQYPALQRWWCICLLFLFWFKT